MRNNADGTVTYTGAEIDRMIARGETKTDIARLKASAPYTDAEFAQLVAEDPDLALPEGWEATTMTSFPQPRLSQENKQPVTIRLDRGVIDHFKADGRGWQSRINAVLANFVQSRRQQGR